MMSWFVPREVKFFEMFNRSTAIIVDAAKEMSQMIDDIPSVEQRSKKIKAFEHEADKITHSAVQALHTTFLTPLDSDDMYNLIGKMDDIMDYMDAVSQRFYLYNIQTVTPEIRELGNLIEKSVEKVRDAVAGLENMKTSQKTIDLCADIKRLETDADHVMRLGMAKLFRDDIDFRELVKLKEVLELLESVTDRCKEVAHIVEGIVLDHA